MSILGIYSKQPGETLDYDIDYKDFLGADDYITAVEVAVSPSGPTVTAQIVNNDTPADATDDRRVKVWCSAGTTGIKYKVTVTITSNSGRIKEDEFYVKVREL